MTQWRKKIKSGKAKKANMAFIVGTESIDKSEQFVYIIIQHASKWNIIWHRMNAFRSIGNNKKDRRMACVCVCVCVFRRLSLSPSLSYKAVYMTEFSLTFVFHKLDISAVCVCVCVPTICPSCVCVCMLRIHYCCRCCCWCCCCCCFAKKRQGCINFRVNAKSSSTQKLLCALCCVVLSVSRSTLRKHFEFRWENRIKKKFPAVQYNLKIFWKSHSIERIETAEERIKRKKRKCHIACANQNKKWREEDSGRRETKRKKNGSTDTRASSIFRRQNTNKINMKKITKKNWTERKEVHEP